MPLNPLPAVLDSDLGEDPNQDVELVVLPVCGKGLWDE
jgi:Na+-transporting NADH:ubiquinone oxidoreductase subunit NqrC